MTDQPMYTTYRSAALTLIDLVAAIPDSLWDAPGLGTWSVRTLVGHAGRSLVTVAEYGAQPAGDISVPDAAAYYAYVAEIFAAPDSAAGVDERAVQAGLALGDDPVQTLRDAWSAADAVAQRAADSPIATLAGVMPLAEYLRTRVLELVVHGLDLSAATGIAIAYDEACVRATLALATDVAVSRGLGPRLALQLCGREIGETVSVF